MWLAFPFFVVVIFMLVGGVLFGGIFTIVLVPLAFIVMVSAVGYLMWARAAGASATVDEQRVAQEPLPHSSHSNSPAAPATPDELVDARQGQ
jgi:hypothetical protein